MEELLGQFTALHPIDWVIISGLVLCYIPLIQAIVKDTQNGAGQNFYTWVLWVLLDLIQLISIYIAHGTYVMFLAFVPCALLVTLLLAKHKKKITRFEIIIIILVLTCVIVWKIFGEITAIVFSTISQLIAGLPLLVDTWKRPQEFRATIGSLCGFLIMHVISLIGGVDWSIKHRFFASMMFLYTLASIFPIAWEILKSKKIRK